jgi:hypothetical protein
MEKFLQMKKIVKISAIIGIAVLLFQCTSSLEQKDNERNYLLCLNEKLVLNMKSMLDDSIRYLHTLANIMGGYESIPAEDRRNIYNDILFSSIVPEQYIVSVFTIWKPYALDNMDNSYIGRPGAGSSGQYAMEINKNYIHINYQASKDIDTVMDYLLNSAKIDRFENIIVDKENGNKTYLIKMIVPIINHRTEETVGIVGCLMNIDIIQAEVERSLKNYIYIDEMAVYSSDGMILCHCIPEYRGKMLDDEETIYAERIEEAKYAVQYGHIFYCNVYSPILGESTEIYMTPFNISNSDTTWTVMTLVPGSYFKRRSFFNIR